MITFDQWSKEVSKMITPQGDEIQKNLNNFLLIADEHFDEEESASNPSKKK